MNYKVQDIPKPRFDISIVVPCYQEEMHLRSSVSQICGLLNATSYSFEMIFVNDCSTDNTRKEILSLCNDLPNTKYLFNETNTGRGGTFVNGVTIASGKYIGFLDIDLEVSCIYLPDVMKELEV